MNALETTQHEDDHAQPAAQAAANEEETKLKKTADELRKIPLKKNLQRRLLLCFILQLVGFALILVGGVYPIFRVLSDSDKILTLNERLHEISNLEGGLLMVGTGAIILLLSSIFMYDIFMSLVLINQKFLEMHADQLEIASELYDNDSILAKAQEQKVQLDIEQTARNEQRFDALYQAAMLLAHRIDKKDKKDK